MFYVRFITLDDKNDWYILLSICLYAMLVRIEKLVTHILDFFYVFSKNDLPVNYTCLCFTFWNNYFLRTSAWSLGVLIPVTGVAWVLGIFYVDQSSSFMQYIFSLCNALQVQNTESSFRFRISLFTVYACFRSTFTTDSPI